MKLEGTDILLVEDEPLIALDVMQTLEEAGFVVTGPVRSVREASRLLDDGAALSRLGAVILDYRLEDGTSGDLATRIAETGMPLLFHTGNGEMVRQLADRLGARVLNKPALEAALLDAVEGMMKT
ncbi:MAG: response regulator [Shimia sp.]